MIQLTKLAREECCGKQVVMQKITVRNKNGGEVLDGLIVPSNNFPIRAAQCPICKKIFLRSF